MIPLRRYTVVLCGALTAVACLTGAPEDAKPVRTDRHGDPLPDGATVRLGSARMRHGGFVHGIAFSPDGSLTASCGVDGRILVSEVATGKVVREFSTPALQMRAVLFGEDGKHLFAGVNDGTVRMLDAVTGEEVRRFTGHKYAITSLALSPNRQHLVAVGYEPMGRIWEVATGREVRQFPGHQAAVNCVAYSPDGKHLVTAGQDGTVRLWEAGTGKEVRQFPPAAGAPVPPQNRVEGLSFTSDGKTLITGAMDGRVIFWDVATGKELRRFTTINLGVKSLALSPNDKFLAVGHMDRAVTIWGLASAKELRRWEVTGQILAVAFSPDGKTLASAGSDQTVRLWDVAGDRELYPRDGHANTIQAIAFFPDGKRVVTSSMDRSIRIWDTATGKELDRLEEHLSGAQMLAVAADNQTVLMPGPGMVLHTWKPGLRKETRPITAYRGSYRLMIVSPDGKTMAVATSDQTIRLLNLTTDKEEHALKGFPATVMQMAFSPDGKMLAASFTDNKLRLWDTVTGAELRQIGPSPSGIQLGQALAISADGRSIATVDAEVRVWETATGKERIRFPRPPQSNNVSTVAFTPDNRLLLVGTPDGVIAVNDLASGKLIGQFSGHRGPIRPVISSADGKMIATGAGDTTILLWDAAALGKDKTPLQAKLEAGEIDTLWANLADDDAARGHRAVWSLAGASAQTVALFKDRLRPATEADSQRIARLILQLDDDAFAAREQASKELAAYGKIAEPALRKTLETNVSAEVKKRIGELLENLKDGAVPPDRARGLRAVEVLEHIGTPEAREVLESLTKGGDEAGLTRAARAALERLARRAEAPR